MRSDHKVAIAIVFAFGVIACEQILGLDAFEKDAACGDCDASPDVADASPIVDVVIPDVVDEATSWANFVMPSSPAEIEAGANADSAASMSLPANGDVQDFVTKKTWHLAPGTASDVTSAAQYCSSQGAGYRLPTRIELVSLLDTTRVGGPYITPTFTNASDAGFPAGLFWTSSYGRPISDPLTYWMVDFGTGAVSARMATSAGVLCIK